MFNSVRRVRSAFDVGNIHDLFLLVDIKEESVLTDSSAPPRVWRFQATDVAAVRVLLHLFESGQNPTLVASWHLCDGFFGAFCDANLPSHRVAV